MTAALATSLAGCRSPDAPERLPAGSVPTAAPPARVLVSPTSLSEQFPSSASLSTKTPPPRSAHERTADGNASTTAGRPEIAIIIDDMGNDLKMGRKFLELDDNLTFSFLPGAPHTQELAEQAFQAGRTVLVHLPMEPKDTRWSPGTEALHIADTEEGIRTKTETMLAAVPHAVGTNNHMGSRFTEHGLGMHRVLTVLKERALFFVDSYTTAGSQGLATARRLAVPATRRHVFLDNEKTPSKICDQLDQLALLARQQGHAVGIGHPNQAMFTALARCGPENMHHINLVSVQRLTR